MQAGLHGHSRPYLHQRRSRVDSKVEWSDVLVGSWLVDPACLGLSHFRSLLPKVSTDARFCRQKRPTTHGSNGVSTELRVQYSLDKVVVGIIDGARPSTASPSFA